jgi:hypothetical protein
MSRGKVECKEIALQVGVPSIDALFLSEAEGGEAHRHGMKRGLSPIGAGALYLF